MLANDNDAVSSSSNDVVVVVVVDTPPVASQDNNTEAVEFNMTSFTRRARRHDGVKRLPSVVLAARAAGILLLEAEGDSIFIAITQHHFHLPLLCMQHAACVQLCHFDIRPSSVVSYDRQRIR